MNALWKAPERLQAARGHYQRCTLCEHRCGANRVGGERGPCKAGAEARVYKHRIEVGEESELIPCHLFYLSGCDLRCVFCIAELNAFDPRRGQVLTVEGFHEAVSWGVGRGAKTLQWVGGEPTIHLPRLLEVMSGCPRLPPVVWKSDCFGTPEAFALLDGAVDIYLADFKFGNDHCARRLAGIEPYLPIVTRNLRLAARQGDLIVRHLLLPGHFDCCFRPIVSWLQANLAQAKFSIREGYLPRWQAGQHAELAHPLPPEERNRAEELAIQAGLRVIM
jgi:putative pyruvate formate lyase activating enzyme